MSELRASYVIADLVASIDPEFIQLTQETIYFFIVIFLLDLRLWHHPALTYFLSAVLFFGSAIRFVHFIAVWHLLGLVRSLESTNKIKLLAAHEKHSERDIQLLLENQLPLRSADQIAARLIRLPAARIEHLLYL